MYMAVLTEKGEKYYERSKPFLRRLLSLLNENGSGMGVGLTNINFISCYNKKPPFYAKRRFCRLLIYFFVTVYHLPFISEGMPDAATFISLLVAMP